MGFFSRLFKSKKQKLSIEYIVQYGEILESIYRICDRKNRLYKRGILVDMEFDTMMFEKSIIYEFYKNGLLDFLGENKDKVVELINSDELNSDKIVITDFIEGFLEGTKRNLYCRVNKINEEDLYDVDFDKISIKEISEGIKVGYIDKDIDEVLSKVNKLNEDLENIKKRFNIS